MTKNRTLDVTLPADTDILMTRVFDAPRRLVWDAMTKPELIRRWYGPRDHEVIVCEVDLRVGGAWRNVSRTPDGKEVAFSGVYKEITPHGHLVNTEIFEEYPDVPSLVTTTLIERDGKTTMQLLASYPSKDVRDLVLQTGMEHGAAESYDRLNELLTEGASARIS